ncbi:MAG: ferrous iron transport protein B [Chitinophagaceae bacterium]|nr:ferrous iron transport protein B [Chitinophagaceae bacterium]
MKKIPQIVLVGNPNSGKTSLFNALTGMNQKVGNFPGVTVDKVSGIARLTDSWEAEMIDLPGMYSLYPRRPDEWVTYKSLFRQEKSIQPDAVVIVVDASNLKRNLLFCTQIIDLKLPAVLALTMVDLAAKKGIQIDIPGLERELGVPVVAVNPRKNKGISNLKKTIALLLQQRSLHPVRDFIDLKELAGTPIQEVKTLLPPVSDYTALHYLVHHESFDLPEPLQEAIEEVEIKNSFNPAKTQAEETLKRYQRIKQIMQHTVSEPDPLQRELFTQKLDMILLHRRWGYVILFGVLFLMFQSVFWLAQHPMDWIDYGFAELSRFLGSRLPDNRWTDLLINGLIAGLSGILMFVPQIMILFGLITLLEDTGYMARISFLTDRLMRNVGLNGKSVMPLISGFACAVPAIMSARGIENRWERLLTILITPLMSCSARLPVYTILIGLVVPQQYVFGFLSLQGLVMMALYMLGLVTGLALAYLSRFFIRRREKSYFLLELPPYRRPRWSNAFTTMVNKARIFVTDAGKVIMIISLLLWALSAFGPGNMMHRIEKKYAYSLSQPNADINELNRQLQAEKLEHSYAGILGKTLEPVIAPLGFDWKIGIALITSFAAREVFVGTMATLYSVGDEEIGSRMLKEKMSAARRPDGSPVFTKATAFSLMIFYVFALQCMSTLAVVRRETRSWKWPALQFLFMTLLAYVISFITYRLFL